MCIESKFLRRKSTNPANNESTVEKQAIVDRQLWAAPLSTSSSKTSLRSSGEWANNAGLLKLSLSKGSEVSSATLKLKLSPGSEESRRNNSPRKVSEESHWVNRPRSPERLAIPGMDDESRISLSSFRLKRRGESSTLAAWKGAEYIMAPSDVRTYLLSQVSHSSGGCESKESFQQQIDGMIYNLGSPESSHPRTIDDNVFFANPVEKFARSPISWTYPSDGNIPLTVQETSNSGSYNKVPLPANKNSPENCDEFSSWEEDVKTIQEHDSISSKVVINWNWKSESTLEKAEPSCTSHSMTFPKTYKEKLQKDSKDAQILIPERPDNDQHKQRLHDRKLTLESVIILRAGNVLENPKISAPLPEKKLDCSQKDQRFEAKTQPVGDEMVSEESSYQVSLRKGCSQADLSFKSGLLN